MNIRRTIGTSVWVGIVALLVFVGVRERRALNDPNRPAINTALLPGLRLTAVNVDAETRIAHDESRIAMISARCASCRTNGAEIRRFVRENRDGRAYLIAIDEADVAAEYVRFLGPGDTLWRVHSELRRRRLRVRNVPLFIELTRDSATLSVGVMPVSQ